MSVPDCTEDVTVPIIYLDHPTSPSLRNVAVVFTQAEHIEPNLVGDLDLCKKIGHPISSDGGIPVVGSGRMAAKLSMPISIVALPQNLQRPIPDRGFVVRGIKRD
jgi:hypothetical protein